MLFAGAGYNVHLYDVTQELVENAIKDIEEQLQALATSGLLRGNLSASEQLKLITGEEIYAFLLHFFVSYSYLDVMCIVHDSFVDVHPQEPRL
jgi:3-hydroxyacyl-CoA dehydrogenase